ncbi:TRAPP trafficking subunit Trs65-domain-containing protein [Spinellus fusiger]|nr:TRAPP trafficking subunit Trs65-domain-containing protein [Spinellus fusiger]
MESNFSSELLFNEAEFSVLTPILPATEEFPCFQTVISAKPRTFVFYDEPLIVYLLVRIPYQITGTGDEVIEVVRGFFSQLDVHVEASIAETHPSSSTAQRAMPSKYSPGQSISPTSSPGSPGPSFSKHEASRGTPSSDTVPFFTHTYNNQNKELNMKIKEHDQSYCCLYPLTIPIVYVKNKGVHPQLSIHFNVSYRPVAISRHTKLVLEETLEYDTDLFETVDLLSGLTNGSTFASSSERPLQRLVIESPHSRQSTSSFMPNHLSSAQLLALRRHVRETLPVRSGLVVKMKTTNASVTDKTVMMSVELENPLDADTIFVLERVEVQVSHSVVSRVFSNEVSFPMTLNTLDQMVLLFHVTLLEDGSVKPPVQPQRMFPSRRATTTIVIPPSHYQDERLQPQRVSIQVYGSPIIDGVCASVMHSKWNTMLDVTGMRQKREEFHPDPRFSSLIASSSTIPTRTQSSLPTSVSVSPGARSVASPISQVTGDTLQRKRIVLNAGVSSQFMASGRDHRANNGANSGTRKAPELEIADGIVVSFTVPNVIRTGKLFPLHIFIVNRSKHTRRFSVMIPSRKRQVAEQFNNSKTTLLPLPMEPSPMEPFMEEGEFLRQYFENETHEADVICLENNVRLSPLGPSTSQTVDIRFIAVKEKLHTIDLIQLVDQDTGFVTNLRHVVEIFVEPCS